MNFVSPFFPFILKIKIRQIRHAQHPWIRIRIRIHFEPGSASTFSKCGSGSGSTFPKCGSQDPDPDPRKNEMDSIRWLQECLLEIYTFVNTQLNKYCLTANSWILFSTTTLYSNSPGCMSDAAFVKVLEDFSGDFIWGEDAKKIEK